MSYLYFCCDQRRRALIAGSEFNGIDFLEVVDDPSESDSKRQRELHIHLINKLTSNINNIGVIIKGGERIRNISVKMDSIEKLQDKIISVSLERPGDFSIYTLYLVKKGKEEPAEGFDPLLSAVDFSFKVNCPSDFDCRKQHICPPKPKKAPEINYLAKDYASFRQLMLDRMSMLMPQWKERNPADLGIALVELLAYVGDYLSYQQDAVATEAYLGTARRRISVRRHARLVDYFMHDGCNARTWVQVKISKDAKNAAISLPKATKLLTYVPGMPKRIGTGTRIPGQSFLVFETMEDIDLCEKHNQMDFYTWGAKECCLPKGATKATLITNTKPGDEFPTLGKGSILIFKEVRGPKTGNEADADPSHRHAVRLIKDAKSFADVIGIGPNHKAVEVMEIEWGAEDALPFPLCISSIKERDDGEYVIENVSIALGNIVLADHGQTIISRGEKSVSINDISEKLSNQIKNLGISPDELEYLGFVPDISIYKAPDETRDRDRCAEHQKIPIYPRFYPSLSQQPMTQVAISEKVDPKSNERLAFDPEASATSAIQTQLNYVQPAIHVFDDDGNLWKPKRDLIYSGPTSKNLVVEEDDDGNAFIRFGDGLYGERPKVGTKFYATYRIGNGIQGNIAAETLKHIISNDGLIEEICNPMPARGGREPESMEEVRQNAPVAFRTQERAVTTADYEEVASRSSQIQKAVAILRWTGSWHTVFLTIDRIEGREVDDDFKKEMIQQVERYRMAGHDLEVDGPRFVSLEIEMLVCVLPEYFRSDVKSALLQVFSNRIQPDGTRGIFHPDNFTFGQTVYLSQLYATAQSVAGVAWVEVTKFQRKDFSGDAPLEARRKRRSLLALPDTGKLELGRLEIARLDNDPNFPENGIFRLFMEGGK
jgi:hypothetical protein